MLVCGSCHNQLSKQDTGHIVTRTSGPEAWQPTCTNSHKVHLLIPRWDQGRMTTLPATDHLLLDFHLGHCSLKHTENPYLWLCESNINHQGTETPNCQPLTIINGHDLPFFCCSTPQYRPPIEENSTFSPRLVHKQDGSQVKNVTSIRVNSGLKNYFSTFLCTRAWMWCGVAGKTRKMWNDHL